MSRHIVFAILVAVSVSNSMPTKAQNAPESVAITQPEELPAWVAKMKRAFGAKLVAWGKVTLTRSERGKGADKEVSWVMTKPDREGTVLPYIFRFEGLLQEEAVFLYHFGWSCYTHYGVEDCLGRYVPPGEDRVYPQSGEQNEPNPEEVLVDKLTDFTRDCNPGKMASVLWEGTDQAIMLGGTEFPNYYFRNFRIMGEYPGSKCPKK